MHVVVPGDMPLWRDAWCWWAHVLHNASVWKVSIEEAEKEDKTMGKCLRDSMLGCCRCIREQKKPKKTLNPKKKKKKAEKAASAHLCSWVIVGVR